MISLSENSILTLLAEEHGILINIHGATEDNGGLFSRETKTMVALTTIT